MIVDSRGERHDLIELFKIFEGLSHVRIDELFMLDENTKGTRGHCLKFRKTLCTRNSLGIFSIHFRKFQSYE